MDHCASVFTHCDRIWTAVARLCLVANMMFWPVTLDQNGEIAEPKDFLWCDASETALLCSAGVPHLGLHHLLVGQACLSSTTQKGAQELYGEQIGASWVPGVPKQCPVGLSKHQQQSVQLDFVHNGVLLWLLPLWGKALPTLCLPTGGGGNDSL